MPKYSGFAVVKLENNGRKCVISDFATLDGAKTARDLYAKRQPGPCYSVVPAAMLSDFLRPVRGTSRGFGSGRHA